MKMGFIGLGNMGTAIISGILGKGLLTGPDIMGADKFRPAAEKAARAFGIQLTDDNREVTAFADILVLAVKPQMVADVITEIREVLRTETVVLSIVAGKTISWLEEQFAKPVKLVRVMPNTPALVGEGISGVCGNGQVNEAQMRSCIEILESFGKAEEVPEQLMDVVGAVSGSSPAYVFLFIEALADGAVAAGMPRSQAYRFAAQAVLGSAKLLLETGKHPGELKDMVCSPGGTTIAAVQVLEEKGMRGALMAAMEACLNKTKKL